MEVTADNAHWFADSFTRITDNVGQALLGKEEVIRLALTCMFAEGRPAPRGRAGNRQDGAGACHRGHRPRDAFAYPVHARPAALRHHGRDHLRPADGVVGLPQGPIFASIVLADEINRASPKTQSALLEVMEEAQVTVEACAARRPSPSW